MNIGIIGGSGISQSRIFSTERYFDVQTPFGDPSGKIAGGYLGNTRLFFIPRHGWKQNIPPSAINYRANIWALKALGCTHVIATTASCSLNERVKPGDLVMLSSFINRTSDRKISFYNGELGVTQIPIQPSFDERMNKLFYFSAQIDSYTCHQNGLVVVVEGPHFPTVAESSLYHSWGADVISMTTVPEVCLAKELSLLYACVASVTDYCNWNSQRKNLKVEKVVKNFQENGSKVTNLIRTTLPWIETEFRLEEIKLLERACQKNPYKTSVPILEQYFPPWIADKIALDSKLTAQEHSHKDVCRAYSNEPVFLKTLLPPPIHKSNSYLPITYKLSNITSPSISSPSAVTSKVSSMNILTPNLHQSLHSIGSNSSNLSEYSLYPTKIYSKNSAIQNSSLMEFPISDVVKVILRSNLTPHKPLPEEIDIDILPVPHVVYPPPSLSLPPSYKLQHQLSFIVPEQIEPQEFPVFINIYPPPPILNVPTRKLHLAQPFLLSEKMDAGGSRSVLDSPNKVDCKRTKGSESKFVGQFPNLKHKTHTLSTVSET